MNINYCCILYIKRVFNNSQEYDISNIFFSKKPWCCENNSGDCVVVGMAMIATREAGFCNRVNSNNRDNGW